MSYKIFSDVISTF